MSDSLPPHLLRRPGTLPGTEPRGRQAVAVPEMTLPPPRTGGQQPDRDPLLLVTPGQPGVYDPPLTPAERPRNVTELRERVRPATPEPWPENTYVQIRVGNSRKAHWNGTDWRMDASPGYPTGETVTVRSEPEQTTGGEQ